MGLDTYSVLRFNRPDHRGAAFSNPFQLVHPTGRCAMNIDRLAGFLSQNTVLLTVFRGLQYARVSAPLRQEPTSQSSSAAMSIALDMYYENKMWNRLVMVIGRLEWINVLEHCAKEKNERRRGHRCAWSRDFVRETRRLIGQQFLLPNLKLDPVK